MSVYEKKISHHLSSKNKVICRKNALQSVRVSYAAAAAAATSVTVGIICFSQCFGNTIPNLFITFVRAFLSFRPQNKCACRCLRQ